MKNYYEIIGVDVGADFNEIKAAYLVKIKEYHPDVYAGDKSFAVEKTAELNEAYNTLKDEELRKEYDLKNNLNQPNANENVLHTEDNTSNQPTEEANENLFKDFGGKVKSFFKGLKDDLTNFKNSHSKPKTKKKNNKNNNTKDTGENCEDTKIDNNIDNNSNKSEINIEEKDKIKRKITIWILIALVVVLLFLAIYVF